MKILFFTENFPPETNAAATRVFERALYWVKDGNSVTIITSVPNFPFGKVFDGYKNKHQTEIISGIQVIRVKTYIAPNQGVIRRTLDFLSFMLSGYLAALKTGRPDIVISTSPQFFCAVAAWWFSKRHALPYIFELGDLWPASITAVGAMRPNIMLKLIELLELKIYRDSDAIVALTQSFKENLIKRGITEKKIAVIKNGVDLWRYFPTKRNKDLATQFNIHSKFVIGYIGTIGMAHDLIKMLDVAENIRQYKNISFLFAGAGSEYKNLFEEARMRQLDNTCFLPNQPKTRMREVWSLCDVALVHLKNTAALSAVIPSKIFEAMGMGLPIIFVGPEGEASQIVRSTCAGICIAPEDTASLAKKILLLAKKTSFYQNLAEKSLAAAPNFSREQQAIQMLEVINTVSKLQNKTGDKIRKLPLKDF